MSVMTDQRSHTSWAQSWRAEADTSTHFEIDSPCDNSWSTGVFAARLMCRQCAINVPLALSRGRLFEVWGWL